MKEVLKETTLALFEQQNERVKRLVKETNFSGLDKILDWDEEALEEVQNIYVNVATTMIINEASKLKESLLNEKIFFLSEGISLTKELKTHLSMADDLINESQEQFKL